MILTMMTSECNDDDNDADDKVLSTQHYRSCRPCRHHYHHNHYHHHHHHYPPSIVAAVDPVAVLAVFDQVPLSIKLV